MGTCIPLVAIHVSYISHLSFLGLPRATIPTLVENSVSLRHFLSVQRPRVLPINSTVKAMDKGHLGIGLSQWGLVAKSDTLVCVFSLCKRNSVELGGFFHLTIIWNAVFFFLSKLGSYWVG